MKAIYTGRGGYEVERAKADKVFDVGKSYVIEEADVGRFTTSLKLEGIAGKWNSVLFDLNYDKLFDKFPNHRYS